jgi:hypothetical protein
MSLCVGYSCVFISLRVWTVRTQRLSRNTLDFGSVYLDVLRLLDLQTEINVLDGLVNDTRA